MRKAIAFAFLVGGLCSASVAQDREKKATAKPVAVATLEKMTADLKEARALLPKVQNKDVREKLELLISRTELSAKELQKEITALAKTASMSAEDFEKYLKALNANSFDDGKLKYIKAIGNTGRFTSAQAKKLLASFSFDRDRTEAAIILHPLVIDPELFATALEAFTFDSSRKQVLEKIGGK